MQCPICEQEGAIERQRTETMGRGDDLLIIEGVPVISCLNCGSISYPAATIKRMEQIRRNRAQVATKRCIDVAQFAEDMEAIAEHDRVRAS